MATSAERALISEATAYRYYPSARSLMQEALVVNWPDFGKVLENIRSLPTVEARAKLAAEAMARSVLANETQVRAIISLSYTFRQSGEIDSPGELRPAFRVPLIDAVLEAAPARIGNKRRKELRFTFVRCNKRRSRPEPQGLGRLLDLRNHCNTGKVSLSG